ncbi:MAG: aldehyde dehydrogenase family protein [Rhodococcus sp. (in: high G+C Gram-positive bacteria)]|uniref:aldehyde dehydrogenase family protein n=1 Tax=Rhodococcus sp. TaxID=1831 RepID=UPI003BB07539
MTEPRYQDVPVDPAQWSAGLRLQQTVDGDDFSPASTVDVLYPVTEEPIATAPFGDAATIGAAVRAAHSAFPGWSHTPWDARRDGGLGVYEHSQTMVVNVLRP